MMKPAHISTVSSCIDHHQNFFFIIFQATKLIDLMKKYSQQFLFNVSTIGKVTQNLPPTSAQSFLRENLTFPAVVLNSNPQNRFYHSIYDDQDNIQFKYFNTTQDFTVTTPLDDNAGFPANSIQLAIRNVSTVLAASIYQMITDAPYNGDKGGSNPILVSGYVRAFGTVCANNLLFIGRRIIVLFSDIVRLSII